MASILIVSSDPAVSERIKEAAEHRGIRAKSVASIDIATQWLPIQPYDILLVEIHNDEHKLIKLFEAAWSSNPLMLGAVFDLSEHPPPSWNMAIQGVKIFWGKNCFQEIVSALDIVAEKRSSLSPFAILLVEDLDSPRDIICSYVEGLGYSHIDGVSSAQEALARLRQNPARYSCIITDVNMPNVDGTALIAEIRADRSLMHLPVIVLTAYATPDNLIECIKAGATGFLVKPPKKHALRAELDRAKRILFNRLNPRFCRPEEVDLLEFALLKLSTL